METLIQRAWLTYKETVASLERARLEDLMRGTHKAGAAWDRLTEARAYWRRLQVAENSFGFEWPGEFGGES